MIYIITITGSPFLITLKVFWFSYHHIHSWSTLDAECLVTTFHCLQLCGLARARVWRGEQTRDKRVSASGWLPGTPPPE